MFEDKNANLLGSMIATQAARDATKQAQAEVDAIEVGIKEALDKVGIDIYHVQTAYALIAEVRTMRVDALVRARLQGVADALMAPAKPVRAEFTSAMASGTVVINAHTGQILRTQA